MNKPAALLFAAVALALGACLAGAPGQPADTPIDSQIQTDTQPMISPQPDISSASPATGVPSPAISITTDRERYVQGESVVIAIESHSDHTIQWMESCSPNLCLQSGTDWICEERECDGPMTILQPGQRLELLEMARSLDDSADAVSRFRLGYQVVSEAPFLYAHSNEFAVDNTGVNCDSARVIALNQAQSSPYWSDIDPTRVFVRWQGEDQTCSVDFSWLGAAEIRAGLWSEGYAVVVKARSGRVMAATAYER